MSDKNIVSQSTKKFSDHYEDNPVTSVLLTALSLAVPQIAIGKEVIDRAVTKILKERFQILIDELATGEKYLTPEIIETEEFIHSFVVVYRAVINTFQREKIRLFARILLSAVEKGELASDRFEMFVMLLNDITYSELGVLHILRTLEESHQLKEKSAPISKSNYILDNGYDMWVTIVTRKIWEDLIQVTQKSELKSDTLLSSLRRSEGLGLYYNTTYQRVKNREMHQIGTPTILYENFAEWIIFESETNNNSEDTLPD